MHIEGMHIAEHQSKVQLLIKQLITSFNNSLPKLLVTKYLLMLKWNEMK